MKRPKQKDFCKVLLRICDRQTTYDRKGWTQENPLWGQCAVVTLLAQDVFGGELVRASLVETKFAQCRWHFWNRLPSGKENDFTWKQFGGHDPKLVGKEMPRFRLLSSKSTALRYKLLKKRYGIETRRQS